MRFGCCVGTSFLPQQEVSSGVSEGSLVDGLRSRREILERNGFDYVEAEVGLVAPLKDGGNRRACHELLKVFPLKAEVFSAFVPPGLAVVGPRVNRSAIRRFLELSTSRVADAGGQIIIWGSGKSRSRPADFPEDDASRQIEEFLQQAADFARANGILIAIEPLNREESNTINRLGEALRFVDKVNREEVKVMADLFHLMQEREPFTILEDASQHLVHVHVSDNRRLCPGKADYPLPAFIQTLKKTGYDRRISMECVFRDFARETREGLDLLRALWNPSGGNHQ